MPYVVLARKYRPADFGAMVGQEPVVQALTNALLGQRLHHAYLFTGTRGVGKTTVSRILAKSLNCTGPDGRGGITATPCGTCQACREIDAGRYVDYVELDAASNRGVEEITRLLDQAVYKPVVGRFKVYMIDEVHMLSTTAFNAMLKTLEEPPEYLKFVLATTDPQKVPPTVLSRCLQFNLRPMAPETIQAHLAAVLAAEQLAAEPGALRLLARAARGSMRDALSLTDQAIAFGAGTVAESGVRQMLGAVDRGHAVRIVEALAASDGAGLVAAADGLRALGLSASGLLEELGTLLQQMAVVQAVPDALDAGDAETPVVRALAALLGADEIQLCYSIALHARGELGLAPDEHGGLVMALLRMLAFRPQGVTAPAPARPVPAPSRPAPIDVAASPEPASAGVAASPELASADVPASPELASADVAASPVLASAGVAASPVLAPTDLAASPEPASAGPAAPPSAAPVRPATPGPAQPAASPREGPGRPGAPLVPPMSALPATPSARPAARAESVAALPRLTVSVAGREPAREPEPPPWLDEAPPPEGFEDPGALHSRGEPPAREPATSHDAPPVGDASTGPEARWSTLVHELAAAQRIGALARELAMQSQCLELDASSTPVRCRLRVEREMLRAAAPREKLQAALTGAFERQVRLEVEAGPVDDTPARRERAAQAARQAEAERMIRDDPLVRSLMEQYKTARIVPGSIRVH